MMMADAVVTIETVREHWPAWRISIEGNVTTGRYYGARPRLEEVKPPVWDVDQLRRGLRTVVWDADPLQLFGKIAEQERLRREMIEHGEQPLDGRHFLDPEHPANRSARHLAEATAGAFADATAEAHA